MHALHTENVNVVPLNEATIQVYFILIFISAIFKLCRGTQLITACTQGEAPATLKAPNPKMCRPKKLKLYHHVLFDFLTVLSTLQSPSVVLFGPIAL